MLLYLNALKLKVALYQCTVSEASAKSFIYSFLKVIFHTNLVTRSYNSLQTRSQLQCGLWYSAPEFKLNGVHLNDFVNYRHFKKVNQLSFGSISDNEFLETPAFDGIEFEPGLSKRKFNSKNLR